MCYLEPYKAILDMSGKVAASVIPTPIPFIMSALMDIHKAL